jgi:uncharacterized protein YdaU (DUF1376 family)
LNYYRRYIGDYQRDTGDLSLAEHGAYALLLDAYYANAVPLPAQLDGLYRLCRALTKLEQAAVRTVADRYFPVAPDGQRHNARADKELLKANKALETQRVTGKLAAQKRWGVKSVDPLPTNAKRMG